MATPSVELKGNPMMSLFRFPPFPSFYKEPTMSPTSHAGKMNLAKRAYTLILAAFLSLFCNSSFAGEYEIFQKERILLMQEIEIILQKNKICSIGNDCRKKQIEYYYSPVKSGVNISIYYLMDSKSIKEICLKAVELYATRDNMSVTVEFYDVPHKKAVEFFGLNATSFAAVKLTRRN